MYLLRPTACFSNPPICTLAELRTTYTINDLANFHEVLDLRAEAIAKAEREMEARREHNKGKRR